jgi:excinuclease ABC subunit A
MEFVEPNEHFFTFNNPFGACKTCEGYGSVIGIDNKLVIPNENLSVYEGAVAPWKGDTMGEYLKIFILQASKVDFPIHRPYYKLTDAEKKILWEGNTKIEGINAFFKFVESQTYKIQYRVMLSSVIVVKLLALIVKALVYEKTPTMSMWEVKTSRILC